MERLLEEISRLERSIRDLRWRLDNVTRIYNLHLHGQWTLTEAKFARAQAARIEITGHIARAVEARNALIIQLVLRLS